MTTFDDLDAGRQAEYDQIDTDLGAFEDAAYWRALRRHAVATGCGAGHPARWYAGRRCPLRGE